jgi:hypothetical protein
MSSLCSASSNILTLRDEDLETPEYVFSHTKPLVERRIDIKLGCSFAVNGPGNSNCKLEYQMIKPQWAVNEKGMRSMRAWNGIYILLLSGYVLLHTKLDGKSQRINVVLAFELFGEENDPVAKLLKVHR